VGEQMRFATSAFGFGASHFDAIEDLIAAARALIDHGAPRLQSVLVKGSRFMHMERVVEALAAPNSCGVSA